MTSTPLSLAIFDMDGTLLDSQALILAAMRAAFEAAGLPAPSDRATLGIVGLSLPQAIAALAPEAGEAELAALCEHYKRAFLRARAETGGEAAAALYPGARAALERLDAAGTLMSVATGKARRGLDHALDGHDLRRFFIATQTADDAPSKPHPGMVLNALAATGVAAERAAMVGDSIYDIAMARAAGVAAIGVAWGYHEADALREAGATTVIEHFDDLDAALAAVWGTA
jgi:phosphoglycolate phosphatase